MPINFQLFTGICKILPRNMPTHLYSQTSAISQEPLGLRVSTRNFFLSSTVSPSAFLLVQWY